MTNYIKIGIGSILLLFCLTSTTFGLIINPLRPTITVPPGWSGIVEIRLTNEREIPSAIQISFKDHSREKERFNGWINFEPLEKLEFAPAESKVLRCRVSVPRKASGELNGRLAFTDVPPESTGAGPMAIRTRISIPFSVFIEGTETYAAEIQSIRLKPGDPERIEIVLENKGNVHLRSRGRCTLARKGEDKPVASFNINQIGNPIYPGQKKPLVERITQVLEPGEYTAHVQFDLKKGGSSIAKTLDLYVPDPPKKSFTSEKP